MEPGQSEVLLYDGDCGLCTRIVRVVLRADRKGTLLFASLQGKFAGEVMSRHAELRGVDSIAWVEPSSPGQARVLVRSEAVLRLARYLGFPWNLLGVTRLVPRRSRDLMYDWVARRRRSWFRGSDNCLVPTPEQRKRMVIS